MTDARVLVLLLVGCAADADFERPAPELDLVEVPVSVWLLDSHEHPVGVKQLDAWDIAPLLEDVNTIWEPARIRFELDALGWRAPDPDAAAALGEAWEAWQVGVDPERGETRGHTEELVVGPGGFSVEPTWNVVVLHTMEHAHAGGVWIPDVPAAYITETSGEAGSWALANVLAHELGHSLGLKHIDDPGNLMSPGGDRTRPKTLDAEQIEAARGVGQLQLPASGRSTATTKRR